VGFIIGLLIVLAVFTAFGQQRSRAMRETARSARENFEEEWRRRLQHDTEI
jgi:hypothetical protein